MKVFLDMVGCRLNQSEIEAYARQFRIAGHTLTSDPESADLIVINTCTVTSAAASDSRQKIHQAARVGADQIIITGCWSTLNHQEALTQSGVTRVIDNFEKDALVPIVLNLSPSVMNCATIQREPIPGNRLRTRAFIKVQDGCDNHCTYCVTTLARGTSRSRPIKDILSDIQSALDGGSQEVILTGVHLGSWGFDINPSISLSDLVKTILHDTFTPRLRLSSLEPWDISSDFFDFWQNSRLCRHLHFPLQSGCSATLHRMGRRITPQAYAELIGHARQAIPGISITTDIITGFPGETEDEFAESLEFVKKLGFSNGHVFTFSPRPGTSAVNLPDHIPFAIAKQRNAAMRQVFQQSASTYRTQSLNKDLSVLWEKSSPTYDHQWELKGLSDNYLRVQATSSTPCRNQIMNVHITEMRQDGLVGIICPS